EPVFSEYLELDLATVVPSIAGPKRPQDRVILSDAKEQFERDIVHYADVVVNDDVVDRNGKASFPASDPIGFTAEDEYDASAKPVIISSGGPEAVSKPSPVTIGDQSFTIDHGAVTIAAITSCTNTSNPSV